MKFRFQPIGLRIIKSAVAIAMCYLISFIRGGSGIVFYSQLAALWCIQGYIANSRKNALQRFQGTVIGALYGLVYLLVERRVPAMSEDVLKSQILDSAIISLMIIVILAKLIGCLLPMAAKKLHLDPAIMAAPLISTILDTCSILIYFSIATKMFRL